MKIIKKFTKYSKTRLSQIKINGIESELNEWPEPEYMEKAVRSAILHASIVVVITGIVLLGIHFIFLYYFA